MIYRYIVFALLLISSFQLKSQMPTHFFRSDTLVTLVSSNIVSWRDVLNESIVFNQAVSNRQPILSLNDGGHDILEFQNANNFLTLNASISPKAIVVLLKLYDLPNYARIIDRNVGNDCGLHVKTNGFEGRFDDVSDKRSLFSSPDLSYAAISIITSGNTSTAVGRAYFSNYDLGLSKTWLQGQYQLGRNGLSFNGEVLEVSIFNTILSVTELESYETTRLNYYSPPPRISELDTIYSPDFCQFPISPGTYFTDYQWSTEEDTDTIYVASTGWYKVNVLDMFQRTFFDSVFVQFPGNFISSFPLCTQTDSLYTTNLEPFNVTWQDGSTDPNYVITEGGEYSLTVTDSDGCTYESDTVVVSEDYFPAEVELIETPNFCQGNELFLNSGFAEAETYNWNTGEETAFIEPQTSGQYWVEATNANGCVGRDTVEVTIVGSAPVVQFNAGTACAGNAVVFSDETFDQGSTITDQTWIFPLDTTQGSTVETTFAEAGQYPVELTVTLANGCAGTGRDTVEVNHLPLVDFNFDNVVPCAGNEVAYESQSGVPGNGEIAAYAWTFGNGNTDAGIVGTTVFENQGVNTVQLAVTTTAGCIDSLVSNVVVLGSPVVEFTFDTVCVGMPTVFNEAVDISASGAVFYNWQFGDGFFSNFPNTSHVYSSAGVYNVQLTATGNDFGGAGCVNELVKQVRVYNAPQGNIAATDACLGAGVVLTDLTMPTVQGGVADYLASRQWVVPFGSAQGPMLVGTDSLQIWDAGEADAYLVEMDFVTAAGCTGSASANVEVLAIPQASFILDIPTLEPPFQVSPENMSVDTDQFLWLVNGDVVSTEASPQLLFPDTGVYEVSLVATNNLGCNDTTTRVVEVINPVWDIALIDIRYSLVGNRLQLRAVLGNNGNAAIHTFRMAVQLGLSTNTDQEMMFSIAPGEVREFLLPQEFEYLPSRDLPYICLEVAMQVEEANLENNDFCIGLEKEKAVFIDPYPNPTFNEVKLGFVLPTSGDVTIRISDASGREITTLVYALPKGYSLREIDLQGFSEGTYILQYSFLGEEIVKRVVLVK